MRFLPNQNHRRQGWSIENTTCSNGYSKASMASIFTYINVKLGFSFLPNITNLIGSHFENNKAGICLLLGSRTNCIVTYWFGSIRSKSGYRNTFSWHPCRNTWFVVYFIAYISTVHCPEKSSQANNMPNTEKTSH